MKPCARMSRSPNFAAKRVAARSPTPTTHARARPRARAPSAVPTSSEPPRPALHAAQRSTERAARGAGRRVRPPGSRATREQRATAHTSIWVSTRGLSAPCSLAVCSPLGGRLLASPSLSRPPSAQASAPPASPTGSERGAQSLRSYREANRAHKPRVRRAGRLLSRPSTPAAGVALVSVGDVGFGPGFCFSAGFAAGLARARYRGRARPAPDSVAHTSRL